MLTSMPKEASLRSVILRPANASAFDGSIASSIVPSIYLSAQLEFGHWVDRSAKCCNRR